MALSPKQQRFAYLLGVLLVWIHSHKVWAVTFGEAHRPRRMVRYYVKVGLGSRFSLHPKRLAVDLNLFINGKYQASTKAHEPIGKFWESLDPKCRWGGRFKRKDGNHYECAE